MSHRLASLKRSNGDAAVGRDGALFQRTFPRLSRVQVGRVYDDAERMVRVVGHVKVMVFSARQRFAPFGDLAGESVGPQAGFNLRVRGFGDDVLGVSE